MVALTGRVESVVPANVAGWMRVSGWLAGSQDVHAVRCELLINGHPAREFVADRPVKADARAELPEEARRFVVPVPIRWNREGENELAVAHGGEPVPSVEALRIELDPELVPAPPPPPPPIPANDDLTRAAVHQTVRGRLERVEAGVLHGWLWDVASLDPVRFALLVNEREVGEFVADQKRADLARNGIGDGAHAFKVKLRPEWLGRRNTFTVRILPDRQRLPDALVLERPELGVEDAPGGGGKQRIREITAPDLSAETLDADAAVRAMRGWPTERIVEFFGRYEAEVMLERAKRLLRERNWPELASFHPVSLQARKKRIELTTNVGRGLLYNGEGSKAADVLGGAARAAPDNAAVRFYTAVACARSGQLDEAVAHNRAAVRLAPTNKQYLIEHGINCRRLATASTDGDLNLRKSLLSESIDTLRRALAIDDAKREQCLLQIARSEMELDRFGDTIATLESLLASAPDHVDALMLLSQALVAAGRVKEALAVAERVVELDPLRQGPRFQLRSLQSLAVAEDVRPQSAGVAWWNRATGAVEIARLVENEAGEVEAQPLNRVEFDSNPAMALASLPVDWLLLATGDRPDAPDRGTVHTLLDAANSWAGRAILSGCGTGQCEFWRRDLLVGLAEADALPSLGTLPADLGALGDVVATIELGERRRDVDLLAAPRALEPGPVVAMSHHGVVKFGGGEHFLASMAEHYREMGHDPILVGTRPERLGEEGVAEDGMRYAFVSKKPAELRKFFLRTRPRFVHVLSGLGFQVAEALEYLDIPFVYGVHFWRDCLGLAENDTRFFAAHDREPIPKPAFRYVVEKAATIYSNSEYTRNVLQEAFSVRTPVVYSLPHDVEDLRPGTEEEADAILNGARDYVLLVNAKSDKGFTLIVEVAKRTPKASYLVIASQSDRSDAEQAIEVAGVGNVRIIDHTDRMDILYSRARAVAVPSYRFVETFSRVCIEAQRYGKPVLGSTIGNVPFLLRRSGIVLPEEPEAWAEEVRRLYSDESHYRHLQDEAFENARRYGYRKQAAAIAGVAGTLPGPVLIGIGSGVGNMLHVGPMIRNIARRIGRRVDLVLTEDHQNAHFLLQHDEYVNSVYALGPEVLRRRYDTVFITHSFGNARLPFQGRDVIYARDWRNFEPAGPLHETVYNLESAKALLGVPYDEEDIRAYHIGNHRHRPVTDGGPIRIGLHGGSKEGFWSAKRWPHHTELARRLQERGYEVSSFGIAEEYVPGTVDRTGGSIAEMTERMAELHYFISNDSGVMNIANALGLPVMGLFGPTNPLTRGPIGPNSRWLGAHTGAVPCEMSSEGLRAFQTGQCRCIDELPLDRVEAGVMQHLTELGLA